MKFGTAFAFLLTPMASTLLCMIASAQAHSDLTVVSPRDVQTEIIYKTSALGQTHLIYRINKEAKGALCSGTWDAVSEDCKKNYDGILDRAIKANRMIVIDDERPGEVFRTTNLDIDHVH